MNPDTRGRLDYLADSVALLWPDAGADSADSADRLVVLPSMQTPRLLVPRSRRAAAAAVRRYTAQQRRIDRLKGLALATGVQAGLLGTRPPVRATSPQAGSESIDDHLRSLLGEPVVTSLAITRARPNRKPVLQVFDRRGRTIAFAKVGVSALAAQLVDAEATALEHLHRVGLAGLEVPRLVHHGHWRDCSLLVASALPSGPAVRVEAPTLQRAMREVSQTAPGSVDGYLKAMRARAVAAGERATEWTELFEAVVASRGVDHLPVGAWHGDWTPWNCSRRGRRLLVWDWERFTHPAPLGFDTLHFALNRDVETHRDRFRSAASALVVRAGELLAPWGVGRADAQVIALLYILDIALRYLADDARTSDPGGLVENWAFPTVRAALPVTAARRADL